MTRGLFLTLALLILNISTELHGQTRITRDEYIKKYQNTARSLMERYGVPASIIMAQGILESGNGNSTLARTANNHFGIKCHSSWKGPRVYHDDDAIGECFRKYRSADKSFQDHSEFLRGHRRYAFLFDLAPTDYKGWAHGLRQAGYATDPQYAQKLIRIIEESQLFLLDRGVEIRIESPTKGTGELVDPESYKIDIYGTRNIYTRNRIQYIIAKEGDTYQSLTKELEMMPWQLAKYNEIERNARIVPGQEIYIQPKRWRAERNHPLHVVEEGETMYDISQTYGVKLKWLYKRNRMEQGEEPEVGERIFLRGRRPRDS